MMSVNSNLFTISNTSQSGTSELESWNGEDILGSSSLPQIEDSHSRSEVLNLWVTDNYPKDASSERTEQSLVVRNTESSIMTAFRKKSEEAANEEKAKIIREKMISIIRNCYFEPGIWTAADQFFEDMKKKCGSIDQPLLMLSDIVNKHIQFARDVVLNIVKSENEKPNKPSAEKLIIRIRDKDQLPLIYKWASQNEFSYGELKSKQKEMLDKYIKKEGLRPLAY